MVPTSRFGCEARRHDACAACAQRWSSCREALSRVRSRVLLHFNVRSSVGRASSAGLRKSFGQVAQEVLAELRSEHVSPISEGCSPDPVETKVL